MDSSRNRTGAQVVHAVILVDDAGRPWASEAEAILRRYGYRVARIQDLSMAPYLLVSGGVDALLFDARRLGASDAIALERCRKIAPSMTIVAVTQGSAPADLKRALELQATTVLSWPAPTHALLEALGREGPNPPT